MELEEVLKVLDQLADPKKVLFKEKKFGIKPKNSLGIYHKDLKELAKKIGHDDQLALALFDTEIYEARILCSKILSPKKVTSELAEKMVVVFETWEICDSFCMGLISKSDVALTKAMQWVNRPEEFVKRAGFVLMASYGFADKKADNRIFEEFLSLLPDHIRDDRIYVKKAINWALRNIGKRNIDLHQNALKLAYEILNVDKPSAQWIAKDAIKELEKSGLTILGYPRGQYIRTKMP